MIAAPGAGSGTGPEAQKYLYLSTDLGQVWTKLAGHVQDWGVVGAHSANLQRIVSVNWRTPVYTADGGATWKNGRNSLLLPTGSLNPRERRTA